MVFDRQLKNRKDIFQNSWHNKSEENTYLQIKLDCRFFSHKQSCVLNLLLLRSELLWNIVYFPYIILIVEISTILKTYLGFLFFITKEITLKMNNIRNNIKES